MTQPQTSPIAAPRERPRVFRGEPCRICGGAVHVAWAEGAPESACSQVLSPLQCCGIAFACNACVAEESLA